MLVRKLVATLKTSLSWLVINRVMHRHQSQTREQNERYCLSASVVPNHAWQKRAMSAWTLKAKAIWSTESHDTHARKSVIRTRFIIFVWSGYVWALNSVASFLVSFYEWKFQLKPLDSESILAFFLSSHLRRSRRISGAELPTFCESAFLQKQRLGLDFQKKFKCFCLRLCLRFRMQSLREFCFHLISYIIITSFGKKTLLYFLVLRSFSLQPL